MRNLFWLFVISLSFTLLSCDEDDPAPSGDGIIGTWKVTAIDYMGTSTTTVQGLPGTTANFTGTGYDMDLTITFTENPNNYNTAGDYSIELVTTVGGQSFTNQWTNQGFLGNGTWEQNGDEITATDSNGEGGLATIISQTNSELVLGYDVERTETQQGSTVVYAIEGTYTFERQ